ncbi:MAG: SpoIIE family protein phosphatase [Desulfuromonadales bacterium]|nr:SpoIIE family protein phosphatase [Desulfuromonadales bacterium]
MIPFGIVATLSLLYFGMLFAVAYYADQRSQLGRSLIDNPNVYSFSLAVYCTSWTFYGSVGRAATSGIDFIAIYLGPTLMAFTWWFLLRRMVRVSKEQNIASIADLISSRYGKSAVLGAIVTLFAVLGILPYIALQLKAVSHTFNLLTIPPTELAHGARHHIPALPLTVDTALIVALLLGLFGVLFGARHLDATERHEGLVAAVALESLLKVVAFLMVGIFITYGLFDGFTDICNQFLARFPERRHLLRLDTEHIPYPEWFSLTFMAMMAVMFLPRQFHIMVVENCREEHIHKAMWRFPAYLFLINLFVIPIALGGILLNNGDTSGADFFVLQVPLDTGHPWLALVVFIGGFSASAGMVMVESVALSTMILNHLLMPIILKVYSGAGNLSGLLINLKRISIFAVILLGYLYYRLLGESAALVNIGLISFLAATQFAPAIIGGLYWRRATRRGATVGLTLGFMVWFYTLLIPAFVDSGWLSRTILDDGLFGLAILRPTALLGLVDFGLWSHALFWTLFVNVGSFLAISLLTTPVPAEEEQIEKFVDVFKDRMAAPQLRRISKAPTIIEFVELMAKFIGEKRAHLAISEYLGNREIDAKGSLSEQELPQLKRFTELTLAGSVGTAPARIILENYLAARGSHMEDVFDVLGSVNISRTASREQLSVLYEAARAASSGASLQTVLDEILKIFTDQFRFDLCVIRILDHERQALTVRSQRGISLSPAFGADRELTMDTFIGEAFLTNHMIVVNDSDTISKQKTSEITRLEGIVSFAHAPITVEGQPIGVISASSRTAKGVFTDEFVELFGSLAGQVGVAWRNAQQTERLIVAREQQRELEIAKTIQLGLLPLTVPDIPGIQLGGICVPAKDVGGDYYDFLLQSDGGLGLVIADVSGHNVGAALLMAETRTLIRARYGQLGTPRDTLAELNRFFYEDLSRAELFVTMFLLEFHPESGRAFYASAGHSPALLWSKSVGECLRLDAEGLILGVRREFPYEQESVDLGPGDVLLLYTDGVIEAANSASELFGEERLADLLKDSHQLAPRELIDRILQQVRLFSGSHSFNDDISLVVMMVDETKKSP